MKYARHSSFIAALLTLGCGDDAAKDAVADTTPDTVADTTPGTETGTSVEDVPIDTAPDTAPDTSALCGSIMCDEPPAAECSEDRLAKLTYRSPGSCEQDASGFPLCRYPVQEQRCAEGESCRLVNDVPQCGPPRNTCEVPLSRAGSFISAAHLPAGPEDACCFDYDGDGSVDNGLAELASSVAPLFDASVQEFIDAFIRRGLNAYLLQYWGLDSPIEDDVVGLDMLLGLDPDGVYEDNLLGTERFQVRSASYDGPTPRSRFATASIHGGHLVASSPGMGFIMPLTDDYFPAALQDVRFDAHVSLGDNGRGLNIGAMSPDTYGARFGALFPLSEVFRAVNAFAAGSCPCLDTSGQDLVFQGPDGWQCRQGNSTACSPDDPDESTCIDLNGFCGAVILLLRPDIGDSFSVGIWIQGVSASFEGLVDADGSAPECPAP